MRDIDDPCVGPAGRGTVGAVIGESAGGDGILKRWGTGRGCRGVGV